MAWSSPRRMATRCAAPRSRGDLATCSQESPSPQGHRHPRAEALLRLAAHPRHGESVKTVQRRLGHATAAETLDTYSRLWPDSDDRTRDAIDAVLGPGVPRCAATSNQGDIHAGHRLRADELACKPDPVHRAPCGVPAGGHPSRPAVAGRLQRPTRRHRAGHPRSPAQHPGNRRASWPCSRWGLPSRPGHPGRWWSLTPPFHPYPAHTGRSVFCGTVPRVTPGCR